MHLVGLTTEIYYDGRPCERQITEVLHYVMLKFWTFQKVDQKYFESFFFVLNVVLEKSGEVWRSLEKFSCKYRVRN